MQRFLRRPRALCCARNRGDLGAARPPPACPPGGGGDEKSIRLALLGIPPICDGFFRFLEERGARVVFNEIPRQFAMPHPTRSLIEQYSRYTYPYDIFVRLADIREQIALRRVDGVIHYVQSFCFRQTQDALVRHELRLPRRAPAGAGRLPILTLERRPGPVDMRTETRIEAFLEMLRRRAPDARARTALRRLATPMAVHSGLDWNWRGKQYTLLMSLRQFKFISL